MSSKRPARAAKPRDTAATPVDIKLPAAVEEKGKRPRAAKAAAVDPAELPAADTEKGKRPRAVKAPAARSKAAAAAAAAVDTAELPPAYEELAALHHAVYVICDFLSGNDVICTFDTLRAEVRARARRELRMEDLTRMVALDNDLALRAHDDAAAPRRWQVELVLRSNERRSRPARQRRFRQLLVDFCSASKGAADARALPLASLPPGVEEISGSFDVGAAPAQPARANQPSGGFVPDADAATTGRGGGAGPSVAGASGAARCVSPERRPRGTSPGGSAAPGSASSPGWSPQRRALKRSLTGLPSPPPRPLRRGTGSILAGSEEPPTSSSQEQQPPHNEGLAQQLAAPPPAPRVSACDRFLERLVSSEFYRGQVAYVHDRKAKSATLVATPAALNPHVSALLSFAGIPSLYSHQAAAVSQLLGGGHVMLATPTASGKSLAYNLPVLHALASDPNARAIYIFPTKALAQDQLRALRCAH